MCFGFRLHFLGLISAASDERAISWTCSSVRFWHFSSNFRFRLLERHLSITQSRICSFLFASNMQLSACRIRPVTNWSMVSESCCSIWRNACLSYGTLVQIVKPACEELCHTYLPEVLGPGWGSASVANISWTSIPAECNKRSTTFQNVMKDGNVNGDSWIVVFSV